MLQSGDGCDELTVVIEKGSRKKSARMPFQPSLSPKSAQPISHQFSMRSRLGRISLPADLMRA